MVPIQKFILKTDLPQDEVRKIILNLFHSQSIFLWNMAVLRAHIIKTESETNIEIVFRLHTVGVVAIIIGLFFGVISILFTIAKSDFKQLIGLIPIIIIYPIVLINYVFDSSNKLRKLKNKLHIKN